MMSTEPDAWGRERQLDEVVLAYLKARETDSNLDQQTWIDCYPDLKGDLSDFFRDQARIEQLASSLHLLTDSAERRPVSNITLPWRETDSAAAAPGVTTEQVLGDYEILGELGKGGMGVVYKARQRSLKRIVALKMILSGVHASSEELTRFRREAEAVARLQHPNIVQIYEVGELDHTPFFSLEFVEGGSLAAQLDGTPLPPRSANGTNPRERHSVRTRTGYCSPRLEAGEYSPGSQHSPNDIGEQTGRPGVDQEIAFNASFFGGDCRSQPAACGPQDYRLRPGQTPR